MRPGAGGRSLADNPELDTWIRVEADDTVVVRSGKAELGQGLRSALARIAAEELDIGIERVRVEMADTGAGPDEFLTAGSLSLEQSGNAVRIAAAQVRQLLLEAAAERLGIHIAKLRVAEGRVWEAGSERSVGFSRLWEGRRFDQRISRDVVPKDARHYRIVGRPGPRIDLRDKVMGGAFVHDMTLPGMVFGRVLRPPSLEARLLRVDERTVRTLPGVIAVVRDGSFLGVVAEREEQAERAREALAAGAEWRVPSPSVPDLESDAALEAFLRGQPVVSHPVVGGAPADRTPDPPAEPRGAAVTFSARYLRPFLLHASIGPSAAVALEDAGRLTIWTHSQGVSPTRDAIAQGLGRPRDAVRLVHRDGPGCYGHNGADDAAFDAALFAQAVPGRPVKLQWTREDENRWEPLGPAMLVDLRASLDGNGRVIDWNHEVRSFDHVARPLPPNGAAQLSASWLRGAPLPRPPVTPWMRSEIGEYRNATPYYRWSRTRIVRHLITAQPLRTSALRSLGAFANVFAIESAVDELAAAVGIDPVAFRLRDLADPRARAVIEAAAARIGWSETPGCGLAFARYENDKAYAAVAVEVTVDSDGEIRLRRAVIAADAGQIVDPSGLANQLEGGFLQAASWTLREAVRFRTGMTASLDWEQYPILGFSGLPEIDVCLLDRPGEAYLGAGEAAAGPTAAAIANAVFRTSGLRLRATPFTPDRLQQAQRRRRGARSEGEA